MEYTDKASDLKLVKNLMKDILAYANILGTTLVASHKDLRYARWLRMEAQAVAVNKAANMIKTDLYTV